MGMFIGSTVNLTLGKTLLSCGRRPVFEHEKKAPIGTISSAIPKIDGDPIFI
jgi:hypothetical protein